MSENLFFIKTGDRLPAVAAILKGPDKLPINLTSAIGVKFICTNGVSAAATIVSAVDGSVKYEWGAAETDVAGEFQGEFEIDWDNGVLQTVPNGQDEYIKVFVTADLG